MDYAVTIRIFICVYYMWLFDVNLYGNNIEGNNFISFKFYSEDL